MKCFSSCADVLHRPLILIISRCCFAEAGKEMYQHVKRTCKACPVVVFAHESGCFVALSLLLMSSLFKLPNVSHVRAVSAGEPRKRFKSKKKYTDLVSPVQQVLHTF